MNRIEIPCNPANPVNYLACCGLFDLLARFDPETVGWWRTEAPVAFILESEITEADLLAMLIRTLSDPAKWKFIYHHEGVEPIRMDVSFALPNQDSSLVVPLDWWYETSELDGSIAQKSAWKMYAGQQTVEKITTDMIAEIARLKVTPGRLEDLLNISMAMTGRFGFDPRASRNALDVGYSSNDLLLPVLTFAFTELLAVFGLSSFFPARAGQSNKFSSSRGWYDASKEEESGSGFIYSLWNEKLPLLLARRAAHADATAPSTALFAPRAMRKNYSNLTLAQTIQPTT